MATTKSYSYHAQLLLLTQALEFMKKADELLNQAFNAEAAHVGLDEANAGDYYTLTMASDDMQARLVDHVSAVKALATMCPPDPVGSHDPTDYSQDARFHQMIDNTFDVALGHGVEPDEVVRALSAAVAEGDQR